MWKRICDWAAAVFNLTRQLQENSETIRSLEKRVRDLEEALRHVALEQRHSAELQNFERQQLAMKLESELSNRRLPQVRKKGKK